MTKIRAYPPPGRWPASRAATAARHIGETPVAFAIAIACIIGCAIPLLRAAPSAVIIGIVCLTVVALARGRQYLIFPLLLFAYLGIIYAGTSMIGIMHQDITLLFSRAAILQQSLYTILLPIFAAAFAYYHNRVSERAPTYLHLEIFLLILAFFAKLLVLWSLTSSNQSSNEYSYGLSQLWTADIIVAFIIARRWVLHPDNPIIQSVLIALILFITSSSSQAQLVSLALLLIVICRRCAPTFSLTIPAALVLVTVMALPYVQEIDSFDPNIGIRLYFWRDVIDRIVESNGLGVGFGTETIRPSYFINGWNRIIIAQETAGYIFVGSHNAFFDAGMRLGILGLGLLAYAVLSRSLTLLVRGATSFDCFVIILIIVNFWVNNALSSYLFFFGSTFALGWIVYRTVDGRGAAHPDRKNSRPLANTLSAKTPAERRALLARQSDNGVDV